MWDGGARDIIRVDHLSSTVRRKPEEGEETFSHATLSQPATGNVDRWWQHHRKHPSVKHTFIINTFDCTHTHQSNSGGSLTTGGHPCSSQTTRSSINRLNVMLLKFNPAALIPLKYSKQSDCAFSWLQPMPHSTLCFNRSSSFKQISRTVLNGKHKDVDHCR